ncbi:MAG: hypothetical protein ACPGD8_05680, partial [Flavobacteriales bacterium]
NGWRSFSWFGEFFEVSQNWIYHEKMGWLYRFGNNLNSLWFYSPVYFQKVDESLFDEKANNLVRQVKYASNNFIKALLVYVCYIALFWLIPGS